MKTSQKKISFKNHKFPKFNLTTGTTKKKRWEHEFLKNHVCGDFSGAQPFILGGGCIPKKTDFC